MIKCKHCGNPLRESVSAAGHPKWVHALIPDTAWSFCCNATLQKNSPMYSMNGPEAEPQTKQQLIGEYISAMTLTTEI